MRTARIASWSSAAALLLAPALWAGAAAPPEPEALLDALLAPPAVAYRGRVMVASWFGKQTRAEEMRVFFLPPDRTRREFLAPDGTVTRVAVSDGDVEQVRLVRAGKTIVGDAVRSYEKVLPAEKEREALLRNYEVKTGSADVVAGRPVWGMTLVPKTAGKASQTLWIDQQTKVVLRVKRFIPRRPYASQANFTAFEPLKTLDESLFVLDADTSAISARGLAPDFMTLDELNRAGGGRTSFPPELPGGFVFESGDFFNVGRGQVRHARYTDGLAVLSLFQTDRPVRLPKGGAAAPIGAPPLPGALRASPAGKVLHWRSGGRHYTLMGDLSRELLGQIARSLK